MRKQLTVLAAALLLLAGGAAADDYYLVDPERGTYLGELGNRYDPDSINNPYGQYGSRYSPDSIRNPYGKYGSRYSPDSATNPYATNPPAVVDPRTGEIVDYLQRGYGSPGYSAPTEGLTDEEAEILLEYLDGW